MKSVDYNQVFPPKMVEACTGKWNKSLASVRHSFCMYIFDMGSVPLFQKKQQLQGWNKVDVTNLHQIELKLAGLHSSEV